MTHRFRAVSAVCSMVVLLLCGPAAAQQSGSAEKGRRLLDVEGAVGAIIVGLVSWVGAAVFGPPGTIEVRVHRD